MIKKTIYVIALILISFSFLTCSRKYVCYSPRDATTTKIKYVWDDMPLIDPNDTIMIEKKSLIENFTVIQIKKEKGVYAIIVESDSIRTRNMWSLLEFGFVENDSISTKYNMTTYQPHYIIYSIKTENNKGYKRVKKGKRYDLILQPCFKNSVVMDFYVADIYIKGMYVPIIVSTLKVFTSPNLDGLHYIPAGADLQSVPLK